jgi:diguanylate cyclase (GGDEF)-like protein/PAS domain S-box-containing protein
MSAATATPLVLVVDDDMITRTLARETLEQGGFAVEEAEDGEAGVAAFERLRPGIILLDVMMPVLDGFEACAALRGLKGGEHVPVLMMTGLDDADSINRAFEVGATDFITKPIAWPLLVHRVRYLLRANRAFLDLAQSEARLANAQRIAKLGHWQWDLATGQVERSEEIHLIVGRTQEELAATHEAFLDTLHAEDRPLVEAAINRALERRQPFSIDFRVVRPDGSIHIVHQQGEVERDGAGNAIRMLGTTQDITERRRAEERIRQLALYDSLTGLPNRNLFKEQLGHALTRAGRSGEVLAVLSLDLNRFKRVNETLGYQFGDLLLRETASRLTRTLRQSDYVARHDPGDVNVLVAHQGADEFGVLLVGMGDVQDVTKVVRRILEAVSRPFDLGGNEVVVGANIGIAIHPLDGTDADSLQDNARTAMYYANQRGRDNYQFYNKQMNASALENLALEASLRKALERHEFVLHYQPKSNLADGSIDGLEAVIRWNDPETGLVPPLRFIPLLEETGLILEVGRWAIHKALEDHRRWSEQGLRPPRIAVNVSAIQLRQKDFVEVVRDALSESHASAQGLDLEITESLLMEDIEGNIGKLRAIRDMGVNIAIDDFGTGYSSLGYVARLPVQCLKIDRSFIVTMLEDSDTMALVRMIVSLAQTLRLKVVAEGVETEPQAQALRRLRCDQAQGYLYSKPLSFAEMTALLAQEKRRPSS